jgi:hypothetical protein
VRGRRTLAPALVAALFTLAPGFATAQAGDGSSWADGDESGLRGQGGLRVIVPERYRFLDLDQARRCGSAWPSRPWSSRARWPRAPWS